MSIDDYLVSGVDWYFTVELQKPTNTPWSPPVSATIDCRILNNVRRPISDAVTGLSFSGADVTINIPATETSKIRFYATCEHERPIEIEVKVDDASLGQPETFYYQRRCRKGTL